MVHGSTCQELPRDDHDRLPAELMRRYEVLVLPRSSQKTKKLREISAQHIGKLVSVTVGGVLSRGGVLHRQNSPMMDLQSTQTLRKQL